MRHLFATLCLLPSIGFADVPRVMTDIAPIHSLTAQVMGDLGTPDLLLPPGADPHDFALRPSDAQALGAADLVIWVGHGLTPWLEEPLTTLAPQAARLELLEAPGWDPLEVRDHKAHDDHGDDHDEHGHDDEHDHDHDHGHDHGEFDPHAWVDPAIARVWLAVIADQLATADPENAAIYAENAANATNVLAALEQRLAADLAPVADRAYILPHDGYQYFEARFGLTASGAIAGIDARDPGPAQVATLREQMAEDGVACVFSDAEIGDGWATLVIEGTDAKTAQIDAVGAGLDAGPGLYAEMLNRLGTAFSTCLAADT